MSFALSDYLEDHQTLVYDGEFECLALSNSNPGMTFLTFAEDPKYIDEIKQNPFVSCVICLEEYRSRFDDCAYGLVLSDTPRLDYFNLHNSLIGMHEYGHVEVPTVIGKSCSISPMAFIDAENVVIGDNVVIEEFVSIKGRCVIGSGTRICSGCQIGGEGYEFKANGDEFLLVKHDGVTEIGENVHIWPNVSIHRAVYYWDKTVIGPNTNINSGSHIDHGAKLGRRVEVCAGAIISGRVQIGDFAFIGPGAIVSNRIKIGRKARVSLGSVVTKDVVEGSTVSGNFAIDHASFLDNLKRIR